MFDLRELEEGVSVGGVYTLERWIRNDSSGTFFAALTGDGERLLIKLAPEHGPDAERQLATWQRSRNLRHPHLQDLRDVGRSELPGGAYIYSVYEYPEDVLASAIEQGPLSQADTLDVLDAALAALRYLHGQGLVHGSVDPDHIVAIGEVVKLTTDGLRESDDLEGCAEDVRQLGEMVRRLRTTEPLNEPLATIVQHATSPELRNRWTLAEIAATLERPAALAAVATPSGAPPVVVPPVVAPPVVAPPVAAAVAAPIPPPVVAPSMPPSRIRDFEEDARPSKSFPRWIFAGVAILLFSILLFNLRRKPEAPAFTPVSAPKPAPVEDLTPPPVAARPASPAVWRVIAFTYRSREAADKKVKQINSKWPDLHAEVFSPKGRRGYFLVALGDGMTRDDATRLQRKARGKGLPRDTYVQNYD
jgi:eukaryotic-like serine/threonine-protein kinase